MATVYSLICWGGSTGKSVTGNTSTDILTHSGSSVPVTGTAVVAQSTVSGVTSGTTYYVRFVYYTTFTLNTTLSDAVAKTNIVDITATTSFYLKSKAMLDYVAAYPSRWDTRIYDGIGSWNSGRSAAAATDSEIAEIAEAFIDYASSTVTVNVPSGSIKITTQVDGVRSSAFHGGVVGASAGGEGYIFHQNSNGSSVLTLSTANTEINGFTVRVNSGYYGTYGISLGAYNQSAINIIAIGPMNGSYGRGFYLNSSGAKVIGCVSIGWLQGLACTTYQVGLYYANCTVTKCGSGIVGSSIASTGLSVINNVSIGNTTNYSGSETRVTYASNNAGGTSEAWITGSGTRVEITESSPYSDTFSDWSNNNFTPTGDSIAHTATSQLIDAGSDYYQINGYDCADSVKPSYKNGASTAVDIGAYEFDWGYGGWPNTVPISITGIVDTSQFAITKQSDDSEIYNGAPGTSYSDPAYNTSADIPVYLWLRKGSSATYYHPVKVAATISVTSGLTYSFSGLQNEDIAAATYDAQIDTDWGINWSTGAITHDAGTTRYTVQGIYSMHQNESDSSTNVHTLPKMRGTTPTIFELINDGDISDADLEDLAGGSIEFQDGTLWSNLWTTNTMAAAHDVYVVQNGAKYTSFWSSGPIDVLLKVANAGALIDSGIVTVYARPWGYTYAQYEADLSGGGRTVAPLATLADAAITETEATVGGWTDITVTFGSTSKDFGDGDGSQTYYCVIDCNSRPLSEVYQRMQYLTRDVSTATLNGVEGWQYAAAHSSYTPNTIAPFGIYSGGIWALAKGVWLDNVPSGDSLNYIVTDDSGGTHQNTVALNQSVTVGGVVTGSRVQIYDNTNATELLNTDTAPYYWEDASAPVGDREIRVRIAYLGKVFFDQVIGTCGTSASTKDVSYSANQQTDTTYVNNGIDGSAVTNISVDATVPVVKVDESSGAKTWPQIYAYLRYYQTTATGIDDANIDCISSTDTANYFLDDGNSWKLRNINANPLTLTGGWARGSTAGTVASIIDAAGSTGNIYAEPDHVVAYQTSGTYAITGDISTVLAAIPSASANASATLSAAAAAGGIDANMTHTLGYKYVGRGIPPIYPNQPTPIDPGDPFRVEGT